MELPRVCFGKRAAEALSEPRRARDASWEAGRSTREEQPQLHMCMHMLILPLRHQALVCVWNLNLSPASHLARRRWYRRDGYGGQGVGRQAAAAQDEAEVSGCLVSVRGQLHLLPRDEPPQHHARRPAEPTIRLSFCRERLSLARMRRRGRQANHPTKVIILNVPPVRLTERSRLSRRHTRASTDLPVRITLCL